MDNEKTSLELPPPSELKTKTARGVVFITGTQVLCYGIRFLTIAIMARLLTARDYGLLGMVMALVGFTGIFAELGLSAATIQRSDLNARQLSTLFWTNAAIGAVLSVIAVAAAPLVAWFYGEKELLWITVIIGMQFAIAGLGVQHRALLVRRMRFGRLSLIQIISLVLSGGFGIWAAASGWGVYALVVQAVIALIVSTLGCWTASGWVPGPPVRGSGVRDMLKFGGNLTAFNILDYITRNADKVLLGKKWGAAPVGFYTRAYALLYLPIGALSAPLAKVMVPCLSALKRDMPRYREVYVRAIGFVAFVSFPLMLILAVFADAFISIAFGKGWEDVVPIFRILCIAGVWRPIYSAVGWLYVSSGRTDRFLRWGLISTPVVVAACAAGLPWGAVGVATGYVAAMCALAYPCLKYAYATVDLKIRSVLSEVWPMGIAAVVAGVTALLLRRSHLAASWMFEVRAVAWSAAAGAVYLIALALLRRRIFSDGIGLLRSIIRPESRPKCPDVAKV